MPTLLVERGHRIQWRNDAAERFLRQHALFAWSTERLSCTEVQAQRELALVLCHSRNPGDRRAACLRSARGDRYFVLVERHDPRVLPASAGDLLTVMLHALAQPRRLDEGVVAQCFALTRAEAAVAVGLAEGATLQQLADRGGVSLHTVRTQLKRIMDKTDARRQADLVRLLLSLPPCACEPGGGPALGALAD